MFARVLLNSTYENNRLYYKDEIYDASLNNHTQNLVDSGKVDLTKVNKLILVPHTKPEDKNNNLLIENTEEQLPYLRFTVIGIERNKSDFPTDVVNIVGKVIYENLKFNYVLIKIERQNSNYEILKLNGKLHDTIVNGKGYAVEKMYDIQAKIESNKLFIEDAYCISRQHNKVVKSNTNSNVIYFDSRPKYSDYEVA